MKRLNVMMFVVINSMATNKNILSKPYPRIVQQARFFSKQLQKKAKQTAKKSKHAIQNILSDMKCKTSYEEGKKKIMHLIQKEESSVDVQQYHNEGPTPLLKAVEQNDIEFAEILLQNGANPNFDTKQPFKNKPLFYASSAAMAKLLKQYGADVHARHNRTGFDFVSSNLLHYAIRHSMKDDELFMFYLDQGLDPHELNEIQGNLWHSLLDITVAECPIERFAKRAKKLHELGVCPYQQDKEGMSAADKIATEIRYQEMLIDNFEKKEKQDETDKVNIKKGEEYIAQCEKLLQIMKNPNKY